MRTTVNIDEELLVLAKQRAHAEHKTLGDFIEDALRRHIMSRTHLDNPPIRTFNGGGGFLPGIDPSSNRSMLDAADDDYDRADAASGS